MKILHLGKYYPPHKGGIEKTTQDIVEGLNSNGINCDVIALSDKANRLINDGKQYKIYFENSNLKAFSGSFSFDYVRRLKKIANEYDIIHVHFPNPIAGLALLYAKPNAKIVIHWHSDIINKPILYFFYAPLEKRVLKIASEILVTSPNYLEKSKPLKRYNNKCKLLPSCCDPVQKRDGLKLRFEKEINKSTTTIFSLGRLVPYKGFGYLIESAKYLDDNYKIYIGGDGPLYKKLESQIRKNKLQKKVILLGRLTDNEVTDYYNLCDIFCLPSIEKSEAFGLVQCEAFSVGKPVVSTMIEGSGVSWVNQDNITGKTVLPKSGKAIADAIKEIGQNPDLKMRMSQNAIKRYQESFRKEIMIDQIIKYYKNL